MKLDRRGFLKGSALATTSLFIPKFLQGFSINSNERANRVLVVIQLSGGNDGLNTIIPYQNDNYYKNRPGIGLKSHEMLRISHEVGFHSSLYDFAHLFESGEATIINNVGYPNPNRSHFRSMDIWQTASASDEHLNTGWIGRFLDSECEGMPFANSKALEFNESLSLALKGDQIKGLALQSPEMLYKTTKHPFFQGLKDHSHDKADYLYKTLRETRASADYLYEKSKVYNSLASYPNSKFGKQLRQVGQLINSGSSTMIYYVSLSGFDTHARQKAQQARLLKQYSEAVSAFCDDLKAGNRFNDTLIMTFSEFGRRVKQNASGGTDHGAANNLFMLGGKLKSPGFYNNLPNLTDLDQGDIKHTVDFRQVYATVIEDWLGYTAKSALRGKPFEKLNLV